MLHRSLHGDIAGARCLFNVILVVNLSDFSLELMWRQFVVDPIRDFFGCRHFTSLPCLTPKQEDAVVWNLRQSFIVSHARGVPLLCEINIHFHVLVAMREDQNDV